MIRFLVPSLTLLVVTACASAEMARPARAVGASYISYDDYPAAALQAGEEGTVEFALDVSREGRVTNCAILRSSGSATLDVTTCTIMRRRARFTPALDRDGRPIEDRVTSKMRWVLR